jgi:arginine N-succinyltransferase
MATSQCFFLAGRQAQRQDSSMLPDFVLRPVEEKDLPGLKGVAASITDGMTSLPAEESALEDLINHSLRSFDYRIKKAGGDHYLFVLEEYETGEIAGTSGIIARVGGFDPFYTYEVRKERFSHPALGIDRELDVLHLKLDHKGPSEVGSLCLKPTFRRAGLGQLLSLARFLFMAAFPKRFDDRVIAEMRGFTDEQGLSPFWESIGRHFFSQTFAQADFLSGSGQKDFIRDLMPKYPIYAAMLPLAAQAVIGKVHRDAEPALRILLNQGFRRSEEVDIFDGGPLVIAQRAEIKTVREASTAQVAEVRPLEKAAVCLIGHAALDFRACLAEVEFLEATSIATDPQTAERLRIKVGSRVIFIPR